MISQPDFEAEDYHLRVMIDQMEREGRSEHAIVDAVRAASDLMPGNRDGRDQERRSGRFRTRHQRLGATAPAAALASNRRRTAPLIERRHRS
jgi:hypothetical protein